MIKLPIALFLLSISVPAFGVDPHMPTPAELKMMPAYCTPRILQNDPVGWAAGKAQFGEGWDHMHHYCQGLKFILRYYNAKEPGVKRNALEQAIGNIDYMLKHTSANYFMRGQFMLDKGKTMVLQGNRAQGVSEVMRAVAFDPNLVAGYSFLADYYSDMGKKGEALKWVTEGLKYIPESKSLQRRYRELGGKEPFPEPVRKPDSQAVQDPQVTGTGVAEVKNIQAPPKADAQPTTIPVNSESESVPTVVAPEIGSPTNPYCRFCPD